MFTALGKCLKRVGLPSCTTAALLFAVLVGGPTVAQDRGVMDRLTRDNLKSMLGTISVEAQPNFAGGQLDGCSIGFNVLAQDWAYKQGAYIKVSGAFGLMSARQGGVAVVLEVIVHDIDARTMNATPSAPASAYFISGDTTTKDAIVGSYPPDVPGAIFVVSRLEPTFSIIVHGLSADKVAIAFARNKGGTDVPVLIDTSVEETATNGKRTHSPKAAMDFADCAKTLMQQTSK